MLDDGNLVLPVEDIFPRKLRADWSPILLDDRGQNLLPINCVLVKSAGRTVLVDTGKRNHDPAGR